LPVCEQLWQAPSHAVSQQTPSTQKPLAHCAATVHVWFGGGAIDPPFPETAAPSGICAPPPEEPPFPEDPPVADDPPFDDVVILPPPPPVP